MSQTKRTHVESFLVVWLHLDHVTTADCTMTDEQLYDSIKKLHCTAGVNDVEIFYESDPCMDFITNLISENVFFIISGLTIGQYMTPLIHDIQQINSIYIICSTTVFNDERCTLKYQKIKGIYTTIESICEQIKTKRRQSENNMISYTIMEKFFTSSVLNEDNDDNVDIQEASFMYSQLFKDAVLNIKDEDLSDMIDYCRRQYVDNSHELDLISKFERGYKDQSPVWWYTLDSFLYKMLNKALRTDQFDTLFASRTFIRHLHEQLAQLHRESSLQGQMTLYRGLSVTRNDLNKMKEKRGDLLSFNNFLSTSENPQLAAIFAGESNEETTAIIFVIAIDLSSRTSSTPFANIASFSQFGDDEQEWLFSMGSVFRIECVEKYGESNNAIWYVPLTLTSDHDPQMAKLRVYIGEQMVSVNPLASLARLMYEMGDNQRSEEYFHQAFDRETDCKIRATLLNNLAYIYSRTKQYDKALNYCHQAFAMEQANGIMNDDSSMSTNYNTMGCIYHEMGRFNEALDNLKQALTLMERRSEPDHEEIAAHYNNIASIFYAKAQYSECLLHQQCALNIQLKMLPSNHPTLAITFSNIGLSLYHLQRFDEAHDYTQRAIDIDLIALPSDHPNIQQDKEQLALIQCAKQDATS